MLFGGKSVPIGELSSCKNGQHTTGPSKLAVPILSFWLCGVQEDKKQRFHPSLQCKGCVRKERRFTAPYCLAMTSRRDTVSSHAMNTELESVWGLFQMQLRFFCCLYFFLRPQYSSFTVLRTNLPLSCFPAEQTLKHSEIAGRHSAFPPSLLLSLPVLSILAHCGWVLWGLSLT